MAADRVQTNMRLRRTTWLSMETLRALLGDLTREDLMQVLLVRALAAEYAALGIEKDPAATARELLTALGETWADDLSDEETLAFGAVIAALDRIEQVTARGQGDDPS